MFRMSMFKDGKISKPFFKTNNGIENKEGTVGMSTQDMTFWMEARGHGYRCAVDCSVLVGHYDKERDIVW